MDERDTTPPAPVMSLRDILHEEEVKDHFVEMFDIGTSLYQESAFAVYADGEVSELLIPEVNTEKFEVAEYQSTRISMMPLVRRDNYWESRIAAQRELFGESRTEKNEYTSDEDDLRYDHLPDVQRKQIEKILSSVKIPHARRPAYANRLIRARFEEFIAPREYRDDVVLKAHNHPPIPYLNEGLSSYDYPSYQDEAMQDRLQAHSPHLTGGIVSSDTRIHGLSLYRMEAPTPELAYPDWYHRVIAKTGMYVVARHVVIRLTGAGEMTKGSEDNLRYFEEIL